VHLHVIIVLQRLGAAVVIFVPNPDVTCQNPDVHEQVMSKMCDTILLLMMRGQRNGKQARYTCRKQRESVVR